jgi:hypothetical protein
MSVETEVKAAEAVVATKAEEVKAEVVKVVEEVKAEVVKETKKVRVEVSTEEKLFLRETELAYLKLQMQIKDLSTQTEVLAKKYTAKVEDLFKTYALDKTEYVFDAVENAFKAVAKKL